MRSKWANKTESAIRTGEVSEAIIRTMRQILARAINHGLHAHMDATPSCNYEDACELLNILETVAPRVTAEQADKGAAWLYANVLNKAGEQRRTDFAQQFNSADLAVIRHMHAGKAEFQLIGLYDTTDDGARYCTLFPIYRAHGANGAFFDYVARSWQSGGNSFIVNRGG